MKDITIRINGRNNYEGNVEDDTIDIVTEAKLYKRNNAIYLVYEESDIAGFDKCKTTVKIVDDKVKMKRFFENGMPTEMEFKKGMRFSSKYFTPYGPFDLEILTYGLDNTIDETGKGRLKLDYDISLNGKVNGRNSIDITLLEEGENELQ